VNERFFRDQRIRLSSDFEKFRSNGVREYRSAFFILKVLCSGRNVSRLGLIIPKRVGSAVIRNRMRRVLRDIFRKKLQKQAGICDYLVIVRRYSTYKKIETELLNGATALHEQVSTK
jgi:ribonuclease P protein component